MWKFIPTYSSKEAWDSRLFKTGYHSLTEILQILNENKKEIKEKTTHSRLQIGNIKRGIGNFIIKDESTIQKFQRIQLNKLYNTYILDNELLIVFGNLENEIATLMKYFDREDKINSINLYGFGYFIQ